jgi:hypothetical protein
LNSRQSFFTLHLYVAIYGGTNYDFSNGHLENLIRLSPAVAQTGRDFRDGQEAESHQFVSLWLQDLAEG